MFRNVAELVEMATTRNLPISEIMIEQEMNVTGRTRAEILAQMETNLQVMEQAVE